MSAHFLLNLSNELMKIDKTRSTSENADIITTRDEIFLAFDEKK